MARSRKITDNLLDFWVKNEYNVLFEGRHGVGKTAMIKECFERNGLKWKYYSAATMDPWCDFVGIPRVVEDNGDRSLEYILPKDLNDDAVEALFFDEFNRSHKKIRNAVMELIQFKSINGRKFKNLKVVWAAINPHDESQSEYDVENLDLALRDRFHVHVEVPFEPSIAFFKDQFGEAGRFAVNWWKSLPTQVRDGISPRRLEYAMRVHQNKGDVSYVFSQNVNVIQFEDTIRNGDIETVIADLIRSQGSDQIDKWLKNANNSNRLMDYIIDLSKNKTKGKLFETTSVLIPHMGSAELSTMISKSRPVLNFVLQNETKHSHFTSVLDSIVAANKKSVISKYITRQRGKTMVGVTNTLDTISDDQYLVKTADYCDVAIYQCTPHKKYSSNTKQRTDALELAVVAVQVRPDVFFADKANRDRFTEMSNKYLSRTNRAAFSGPTSPEMKRRIELFRRIVGFFNSYYMKNELTSVHPMPSALTSLGNDFKINY
jgi:hypothetical protein